MGLSQLRDPAEEAVKRVVILSDGMANIGVTQPAELVRQAGSLASEGVTVSALGLGLEFNEDLLAAMGDAGGGSYRFVDRPGQLAELFTVDLKLPPGVEVAEIYGYAGSRDRDGYHVFLGDIHGGETRKIVARVHVPDRDLGPVSIADVSLRYADPDSGDGVSTGDRVVATITPDPGQARASVDRGVARKAVQARSAQLLDAGARAWQDGDLLANQARIQEAEDLLTEASVSLGDAGLGEQAAHYASQRGAFAAAPASSEAGNYQLKKSKEEARADSR
jgi:Ca-activated chloride channel family protein